MLHVLNFLSLWDNYKINITEVWQNGLKRVSGLEKLKYQNVLSKLVPNLKSSTFAMLCKNMTFLSDEMYVLFCGKGSLNANIFSTDLDCHWDYIYLILLCCYWLHLVDRGRKNMANFTRGCNLQIVWWVLCE